MICSHLRFPLGIDRRGQAPPVPPLPLSAKSMFFLPLKLHQAISVSTRSRSLVPICIRKQGREKKKTESIELHALPLCACRAYALDTCVMNIANTRPLAVRHSCASPSGPASCIVRSLTWTGLSTWHRCFLLFCWLVHSACRSACLIPPILLPTPDISQPTSQPVVGRLSKQPGLVWPSLPPLVIITRCFTLLIFYACPFPFASCVPLISSRTSSSPSASSCPSSSSSHCWKLSQSLSFPPSHCSLLLGLSFAGSNRNRFLRRLDRISYLL